MLVLSALTVRQPRAHSEAGTASAASTPMRREAQASHRTTEAEEGGAVNRGLLFSHRHLPRNTPSHGRIGITRSGSSVAFVASTYRGCAVRCTTGWWPGWRNMSRPSLRRLFLLLSLRVCAQPFRRAFRLRRLARRPHWCVRSLAQVAQTTGVAPFPCWCSLDSAPGAPAVCAYAPGRLSGLRAASHAALCSAWPRRAP